jgi:putative membrane protein
MVWTDADFWGHLGVRLGVLLAALAFLRHWRQQCARGDDLPTGRVVAFSVGLGVILLAEESPLHTWSEQYLFSAHMAQHLLLILVAPPLLLYGLPTAWLRWLADRPVLGTVLRGATRPAVGFLTFHLIFGGSHLPPIYDLVFAHPLLHILSHLVFVGAALLLWWPVVNPLADLPGLSPPAQVLYFFLQLAPTSLVGAFLTYAPAPLYSGYATASRPWGLSALVDQQIGGLLMWVGMGFYFFGAMTVVFFRWFGREEALA